MLPKDFYIVASKNNNMKQYIIIIALIILITACTPKVDIEKAQPAEGTPPEEPEAPIEMIPEEPKTQDNTIEIKEDAFYPKEKTIQENTIIRWINKDQKQHKISCYLGGTRVTTSENLEEGDSYGYTFIKDGEYTCIDAIYGLRSTITVGSEAPLLSPTGKVTEKSLLSPTGSVVVSGSTSLKGAALAGIAVIAIIALLFFIFARKRK